MAAAPSLLPGPLARRYLVLALPYLSTDRIRRRTLGRSWRSAAPPEAPLAVVARVKSALRLAALDENAVRLGLRPGQPLADARAMIPALETVAEDSAADRALVEGIADWAERYTPLVALDADNGLILDITGAAHLLGGEEALLADLHARLAAQGFFARAAIADTPGAASAVARFGARSLVPPGAAATMLAPLPLAALRLDRETVSAMDRVGLKRIGQIAALPRAPLAARFGTILIRRLDQAFGREEESIAPRRPVAPLIAERRFAEPIAREEDVAATLTSLAATLARSLETQGLGARTLELALFRVDGFVARTAVAASRPIRAPKLVLELFRERFAGLGETFDAGFGFDVVRLAVQATAPLSPAQIDLAGDAVADAGLSQLIDRIGARLGPARIGRIAARDSHVPERAEAFVAPEEGGLSQRSGTPPFEPLEQDAFRLNRDANLPRHPGESMPSTTIGGRGPCRRQRFSTRDLSPCTAFTLDSDFRRNDGVGCQADAPTQTHHASSDPSLPIDRPLRLFARPEPVEAVAEVPDGPPVRFRWRRALYRVARAEGPERIASEWWRDDDLTRDYFRVEDVSGRRFWLFREGLYGRETAVPRWYLHGVFA